MSKIEFSKAEKEQVVNKIQLYFSEELEQKIGGFDAEFLLDFFAEEIGSYFYNRGLNDALAIVASNVEKISDEIYAIEKPVDLR